MRLIPLVVRASCLGLALWSIGCQSAGTNSATLAASEQGPGVTQSAPAGIDDDSDFDRPGAVQEALAAPGKAVGTMTDAVVATPKRLIDNARGDTAHNAVLRMEDKQSADNRRAGMNRLLEFEFAHRKPYTRAYELLGVDDPDPTVRATALRACNRSRDQAATPVFIKSLADKNEWVRLEAAKGLANLPDPNAADPLIKLATSADESRDVRIAAIDAAKYYRTLEVARGLSSLVSDHDFSLAWQARRSLKFMTHKDFGYDSGAWLGYFAGADKPLG